MFTTLIDKHKRRQSASNSSGNSSVIGATGINPIDKKQKQSLQENWSGDIEDSEDEADVDNAGAM